MRLPSHPGIAAAPKQMAIQELTLRGLISCWESGTQKGNVREVASQPPDQKDRNEGLGPYNSTVLLVQEMLSSSGSSSDCLVKETLENIVRFLSLLHVSTYKRRLL